MRIILSLLVSLSILTACKSKNEKLYEQYVQAWNNNDSTTLNKLLHEDFKYSFNSYVLDKPKYIKSISGNPNYPSTLKVIEYNNAKDTINALVKIINDYDIYLGLDYPLLKHKVYFYDNQIAGIRTDTINGMYSYLQNSDIKVKEMNNWFVKKYPNINLDSLSGKEWMEYLNEYYEEKKAAK